MSIGLGLGLAAGLGAALLFGCGAVLQASAVRREVGAAGRLGSFLAVAVRDPRTLLAVALYLLGFLLHVVAVALVPLYLAQATVAMSLPVTALLSRALAEHLGIRHWSLLGAVTLGLVLLALGSGKPGASVTDAGFAVALVVGVLAVAAAAPLVLRLGGVGLGTAAGVGYAGSAIAIRGLDWPVGTTVVAAAVAVPAFSLVAFWLYSLGMSRGGVPHVTAPLTVVSTFVPALVGVAWLGDGVRDGWWAAVLVGLVLATAGTLALGRDVVAVEPARPG